MELREIEQTKIECARKFFDEMNRRFAPENVKYDVVDSFGKLMDVVGMKAQAFTQSSLQSPGLAFLFPAPESFRFVTHGCKGQGGLSSDFA